jgi:hypothetical protein
MGYRFFIFLFLCDLYRLNSLTAIIIVYISSKLNVRRRRRSCERRRRSCHRRRRSRHRRNRRHRRRRRHRHRRRRRSAS